MDERSNAGFVMKSAVVIIALIVVVLIAGTWWMGQSAQKATETAVRSISMFYLDELTGRRAQVVETNLKNSIDNMGTAISLLTEDDLSDMAHLQAYQSKMKALYKLEKFAFVDANGLIYTSLGTQNNISEYAFDYTNLTEPSITVRNADGDAKKAIIAMPLQDIPFNGQTLTVCFMEMDMQQMLEGLSLQSDANETTFCNIYTRDGVALSNRVLGGTASETNLLDAVSNADISEGYSLEEMKRQFQNREPGVISFTYNGTPETLSYMPIEGTDWMLTYLIRESVIANQISNVSEEITTRSIIQTLVAALVLLAGFFFIMNQLRRNSQLALEKETADTENRVKQQEMEQRLALQEQLLAQEKQRAQQDKMITALASDYRSVYYVDLDSGEGQCYQAYDDTKDSLSAGEIFTFENAFTNYADKYVADKYRQGFIDFLDPAAIKERLANQPITSYRYLATHDGMESYEMLRMAGVRHPEDRADHMVHAIGMGIVDVDGETRDQMAQSQALSDALAAAEEANKAKTAFLSNMSHEIRTPMNAIIGLDSIALAEPGISDKTREQLEKIGSSARHLLGLINDILDVSRIESGRMVVKNEAFSFSKLLEQVNTIINGQCNAKGLDYECRINGHIDDSYIGDDMKLRQTLINILGNAVKFTPAGGNVGLTVERIAHYEGHSTLRFTMSDTGIGMDEEFLPHIFETFSQEDSSSTNEYGSTGLGLAITKSIVELMNGTIEVQSVKGEGTTFIVTITLSDAEALAIDAEGKEVNPQDMTVLVIDDDPVACEHAKLVLETVGISAEIAGSGADAVEMVRLRHARRAPYNLILVDWKMPEMDGVETTRRIRSIVGDESAIIILTAYNWDDVLEEAVSAGVDSFLAKPLFASNVLEEFQQAFRKKSVEAAQAEHRAELDGRKVLIAEDVEINAEILMEILDMRGIEADHAENGREAVDMFEAHEPGFYDAVLMDMRMPVMDGLAATSAIRALDREDAKTIPIIALTANAFDEDVQKSLQAGLNAHLSKPVEPDDLFATLESLIKD